MIYTGEMLIPYVGSAFSSGTFSLSAEILDADGEKLANVYQATRNGSITKLHIFVALTTTAPGSAIDVRIETVGTSDGFPTGTLWSTNTNGSLTLSASDDYVVKEVTLTSPAVVSRGDVFAIVIAPPASPDQGNTSYTQYYDAPYGFPYKCFHNGTAWAKDTYICSMFVEYSDGDIPFLPQMFPWIRGITSGLFYSDSTYPYHGAVFVPKFDMDVCGWWGNPTIGNTATIKLLNASDSVLKSVTNNGNIGSATSAAHRWDYFSGVETLTAGSTYRISVQNPNNTASGYGVILTTPTIDNSTWFKYIPHMEFFDSYAYTYSTDMSTWTDVDTKIPIVGLIVRRVSN